MRTIVPHPTLNNLVNMYLIQDEMGCSTPWNRHIDFEFSLSKSYFFMIQPQSLVLSGGEPPYFSYVVHIQNNTLNLSIDINLWGAKFASSSDLKLENRSQLKAQAKPAISLAASSKPNAVVVGIAQVA